MLPGLAAHLAGWRRLEDVDARDVALPIDWSQIDRSEAEA